jgi:hypothetical protein
MHQVNSPRVYLTRYVPLSGFLNLLAVYTLIHPEALFHAPGTYGVHPSELSPWKQHRTLVEIDYPWSEMPCLHPQTPAFLQMNSLVTLIRR